MKTAKDLAYKAFCDGCNYSKDRDRIISPDELFRRFDNWWQEWVWRKDHRDAFDPDLNIYVNGKRYIQAE